MRTLLLVAAVSGAVGVALAGGVDAWTGAERPFGWAFAAITAAGVLVQAVPVRLHVERGSAHLVVSEFPLVLGLCFLSPLELVVSRLLALLLQQAAARVPPTIKVVVTLAIYALEAGVAVAALNAVPGAAAGAAGGEPSTVTLVAILAAVVLATSVGSVVLWVAVGVSSGGVDLSRVAQALRLMVPVAMVNTTVSLIAVVLIRTQPAASWLLVIPALVLIGGYRRFLAEREDREFLGMLYGLARDIHAARDLTTAFDVFARTLRDHIGCANLELYLQRVGGNRWSLATQHDGSSTPLRRVDDVPRSVELSLSTGQAVREHDDQGRCTTITYALDLGRDRHLAFVAREPVSTADGFRAGATQALIAVASHARAVLEDVELQEVKSSFLSSVSHELRTPLAVVLGAAETLHEQGEHLSPEVTALLTQRLHAQARRLDGLLRDLLDVDRLGRGLLEPSWSRLDLGALVRHSVASLQITSHQVDLRVDPVVTYADPGACERAVENLVINATKYAPRDTRIRVEVRAEGDEAVLVVQDQGPGVPSSDRDRVFEPFVRLDRHHHSPGTGVGLSLVDRLVRMMGGTVEVGDADGGGARFTVRLPLRLQDPDELTEPSTAESADQDRTAFVAPRGAAAVALRGVSSAR